MQENAAEEGLLTWTRDSGVIVRMRTSSVRATRPKGEYGRYISWIFFRDQTIMQRVAGSWELKPIVRTILSTGKVEECGIGHQLKVLRNFEKKINSLGNIILQKRLKLS